MSHLRASPATSNAPVIGRKRRNDSVESDEPAPKRNRTADPEEGPSSASQKEDSPSKDTEDVKEVTKGVEEVEIEDKKDTPAEPTAAAVPLPDSPELQAQKDTDEQKEIPEVDGGKAPVTESAEAEAGKEAEETTQEDPKVDETHSEKADTPSDGAAETETSTVVDEKEVIEPKSVLPPVEDTVPVVAEEGEITAP